MELHVACNDKTEVGLNSFCKIMEDFLEYRLFKLNSEE